MSQFFITRRDKFLLKKRGRWFITKWAVFITKHDRYHKTSQLSQNTAQQHY